MSEIDNLNVTTLLEHANIGVVVHRWDTSIIYANPLALKLLRLSFEQITGKDAFDSGWHFVDESNNPISIEDFPVNQLKRLKKSITNEVIGIMDESRQQPTWVVINAYLEGYDKEGEASYLVVTFTDITSSKTQFSYHDILESTQDMLVVTEAGDINRPDGPKIVYVNQAFVDFTGYSRRQIIGQTPRILQGVGTDKAVTSRIKAALLEKRAITETLLNYDINNKEYWLELKIFPLHNSYGDVTHFAAVERDVTDRKLYLEQLERHNSALVSLNAAVEAKAEELLDAKKQLENIAFLDPLTNIPNRRYFFEHVKKLMKVCQRQKQSIAFGLIDIDNFKNINDQYGHDIGDEVLVKLGGVIRSYFRESDVYCRYGGEEFAFAASVNSQDDCKLFAKRLISHVRSVEVSITAGDALKITASIGIKFHHHQINMDIEPILKKADTAMYQAKKSGKDQFIIMCD
jgi:diguanylate cyclase (GGDEF)-like protein/PAS domain S-box-containing protein